MQASDIESRQMTQQSSAAATSSFSPSPSFSLAALARRVAVISWRVVCRTWAWMSRVSSFASIWLGPESRCYRGGEYVVEGQKWRLLEFSCLRAQSADVIQCSCLHMFDTFLADLWDGSPCRQWVLMNGCPTVCADWVGCNVRKRKGETSMKGKGRVLPFTETRFLSVSLIDFRFQLLSAFQLFEKTDLFPPSVQNCSFSSNQK